MMLARPDVPDVPMARRHWGTLDAFLLARMRGNVHPCIDSTPGPITPEVRAFEVHPHPDLATTHCSPGLGYSGAITTIREWRELHGEGAVHKPFVDADAILAKFRPPDTTLGDGIDALHELGA
jgi:hypothetical protein